MTREKIERFEKAVRANSYRTSDDATEADYQAAKAELSSCLALLPGESDSRKNAEMLELYAASYSSMAKMGDGKVSASDVAYDIRHNMIKQLVPASPAPLPVAVKAVAPVDVYRILMRASDDGVLERENLSRLSREIAALSNHAIKHHPLCSYGKGAPCDYDCARDFPQTLPTPALSSPVGGTEESRQDGNRPLPYDRDTLGRFVREAWVRWAQTQPDPKPSRLAPYDELLEADKEADRQIGEAVARWTLIGDAASASFSSPATASDIAALREENSKRDENNVGIGMAIAAAILMRVWGKDTEAKEILGAAGLTTEARLREIGVENYDLDELRPILDEDSSARKPVAKGERG